MKKIKPYLFGLIIALLAELLVFNYSSILSMGNESVDLTGKQTIEKSEGEVILSITEINEKISNIYFDAILTEDAPVAYTIEISDEGNYYSYPLAQGVISKNSPVSFYTNIHPYGKVTSMKITFRAEENASGDKTFDVTGVSLNCKRPLFFNVIRFLIVLLIIWFFILLRNSGEVIKIGLDTNLKETEGKRQVLVICVCALAIIIVGYFWSSSHKLLNEASMPHHQQYKELAKALGEGRVALDYEPSEELKAVSNPYDTIYLQANNIEYRGDYAYYNEKYYVYFGIVPEVLLYYPSYLILGKDMPNNVAVFLFYAAFVAGVFLLIHKVVKKYLHEEQGGISLAAYILVSSFVATCPVVAYVYFTADIYSVPIMAALSLTVWGLFFWMINSDSIKLRTLEYFLGSLCMAMVVGCRPQMVLFSFLAIPIFWNEVLKDRTIFSRKSIGRTVAITLPYILVAALVMAYNYSRFGSVFDFGATYSLTNNDMNLRGLSLSRMLLGLSSFLFQPATMDGVFPFLHSAEISYSYMGKIVTEYFFGGIIISNILIWPVLLLPKFKNDIKKYRLGLFVIISLLVSLVIGLLDANTAGVLQRYMADMIFGILIVSAILLLIMVKKNPKTSMTFLKIGFVVEMAYGFLIMVNDAAGINLRFYNPELFYRFANLFNF